MNERSCKSIRQWQQIQHCVLNCDVTLSQDVKNVKGETKQQDISKCLHLSDIYDVGFFFKVLEWKNIDLLVKIKPNVLNRPFV